MEMLMEQDGEMTIEPLGIVLATVVVLILVGLCVFCFCRNKNKKTESPEIE
jgi:hypothetical protein